MKRKGTIIGRAARSTPRRAARRPTAPKQRTASYPAAAFWPAEDKPRAVSSIPAWYRECAALVTDWQTVALTASGSVKRTLALCASQLHNAIHKLTR